MSDFKSGLEVALVDAVDPSLAVEITAAREVKVAQKPLTSATDSVAVTGSVTVSSTDLDIRNLAESTDHVTAHLAAGSTVAVTATDLDVRDLAHATDSVTAHLAAGSTVAVTANDLDIRPLSSSTDSVSVTGAVTATVSATDLDIRDLAFASDSVTAHLAAGSTVAVTASDLDIRNLSSATDSVTVVGSVSIAGSDPVASFGESASVAKDASFSHDYVVTSGKKFRGDSIVVGSFGSAKVSVGVWNGTSFVPKMVFAQQPRFNQAMPIKGISVTGNGTLAIRVTVTNLDHATDLSISIQGTED
jgi:hypothetical protein